MPRTFAIGDIHGCAKTFKSLIVDKIQICNSDIVYCIGDYIDRGKDSRGVVDFILELRSNHYQIFTLRGNHEQMLLNSSNSDDAFELWMKNGGGHTLWSFGISTISELSPVYLDFFNSLPFFLESEDCFFVHAGFNLFEKNIFEDTHAMLWTRDFAGKSKQLKGKKVIHGHDALSSFELKSQDLKRNINIDGGCVYKDIQGMGSLFALNLTDMEWLEVKNID